MSTETKNNLRRLGESLQILYSETAWMRCKLADVVRRIGLRKVELWRDAEGWQGKNQADRDNHRDYVFAGDLRLQRLLDIEAEWAYRLEDVLMQVEAEKSIRRSIEWTIRLIEVTHDTNP